MATSNERHKSGPAEGNYRLFFGPSEISRDRWAVFLIASIVSFIGIVVVWDVFRHRPSYTSRILFYITHVGIGIALALVLSRSRIQWSGAFLRGVIVYISILLALTYLARRLGVGTGLPRETMWQVGPEAAAELRVNLARLVFPIAVAHILTRGVNRELTSGRFMSAILLSCTWGMFLIPDAGPGPLVSFVFIATVMAWLAGLRTAHAIGFVVYVWFSLLVFVISTGRPHWDRLAYFVRERWIPYEDPLYLAHATASIARGGIFGVGLGNASPLTYALPTAESRHVYAVLGQELGLSGCLFVLALFLLILLRGLHIAEAAFTTRAQVGATGIVMTLTLQAFHHIAFNCALSPTAGTPLPFLSAGAPNILFSWVALGLLLSAGGRVRPFELRRAADGAETQESPTRWPLRKGAIQLFFVMYALLLAVRLSVLATDERLRLHYRDLFERHENKISSRVLTQVNRLP